MGFHNTFRIVSFTSQISTVAIYVIRVRVHVCVCKRKRDKDENREERAVTGLTIQEFSAT